MKNSFFLFFFIFIFIFFWGGGGGSGKGGGGSQGGCEQRIEVFVKIKKTNIFLGGGGGGLGRVGGVRVDVIEELKFLGKFTQKISGGGSV